MNESLVINKSLPDAEIYKLLFPQIEALLNPTEPWYSNLANVVAALKEAFDKISWVGFYLLLDEKLFLGPFQGKIACTTIELGKGVCGTSASIKKTIIVEDVNKYPGHIACDSGSLSEIVVPLLSDDKVLGVLDIDSYEYSSFKESDKEYLEKLSILVSTAIAENFKA
jgi:L-methionine (R)-S-oxide reductase